MRILLLLLCCSPLYAGPGFFKLGQTELPAPVFKASESVFQIIVFGKVKERLTPAQYDDYLARMDKLAASETAKRFIRWEIENYLGPEGGAVRTMLNVTAFLVEDKRTLATVRGAFDEHVSYPQEFSYAKTYREAQLALMRELPFDVAVLDSNGEILLSTRRTNKDNYTPTYIERLNFNGHVSALSGLKPPLLASDYVGINMLTDHVQIQLTQDLPGTPLSFSKQPTPMGEKLYLLGYPEPTTGREHNSDGLQLHASLGEAIAPPPDYITFLNRTYQGMAAGFLASRVFANCDLAHGSAGSPLLNARGEVVGVGGVSWAQNPYLEWSPKGMHGLCAQHISRIVENSRVNSDVVGVFFQ